MLLSTLSRYIPSFKIVKLYHKVEELTCMGVPDDAVGSYAFTCKINLSYIVQSGFHAT